MATETLDQNEGKKGAGKKSRSNALLGVNSAQRLTQKNANTSAPIHPGYRARNLDLAKAIGLNEGLCKTKDRMRARNDCPLWLIERLDDYIQRSNCLIGALKRYRNELPERMTPNAGIERPAAVAGETRPRSPGPIE